MAARKKKKRTVRASIAARRRDMALAKARVLADGLVQHKRELARMAKQFRLSAEELNKAIENINSVADLYNVPTIDTVDPDYYVECLTECVSDQRDRDPLGELAKNLRWTANAIAKAKVG